MNLFKKPQLAVRAIITNSKNEILILKRANTSYCGGLWNLPGGKIDFGEKAEFAIKKEILEETSLSCESVEFLFYSDSLPDENTDLHFVNLFFKCICSGEIKINGESSNYHWMAINEINNYQLAFGNETAILKFVNLR